MQLYGPNLRLRFCFCCNTKLFCSHGGFLAYALASPYRNKLLQSTLWLKKQDPYFVFYSGAFPKVILWGELKLGIFLTHISLVSYYGTKTHSSDPDQMPQNVAFDRGLHCLLTEFSLLNKI